MKYYIIAGEASGDLHGANLIKAIQKKDAQANFRVWGGDLMQNTGAKLVKHYKQLAFMGFIEVLLNLKTIFRNLKFCQNDILAFQPDTVILIDYPGFNLRMAKFLKKHRIKVIYYISPQIWAWDQKRVWSIKKNVDLMLCILPFEKDFYQKFGIEITYVGHPLLDEITQQKQENPTDFYTKNELSGKPIIAILPGSRKQEIKTMLPIMLSIQKDFPAYEFVIAGAPSQNLAFYRNILPDNTPILFGQTYALLRQAKAALVTSGTATLETALLQTPQVVCYKGNFLSYLIAKSVVKIKYISLVNLIADQEVVKELIQANLNSKNLKAELQKILEKPEQIKIEYEKIIQQLGEKGASERAAMAIHQFLVH